MSKSRHVSVRAETHQKLKAHSEATGIPMATLLHDWIVDYQPFTKKLPRTLRESPEDEADFDPDAFFEEFKQRQADELEAQKQREAEEPKQVQAEEQALPSPAPDAASAAAYEAAVLEAKGTPAEVAVVPQDEEYMAEVIPKDISVETEPVDAEHPIEPVDKPARKHLREEPMVTLKPEAIEPPKKKPVDGGGYAEF